MSDFFIVVVVWIHVVQYRVSDRLFWTLLWVPLKDWEFLGQLWVSFPSISRKVLDDNRLPGDKSTLRWPSEGHEGWAGIHYTFHHSR